MSRRKRYAGANGFGKIKFNRKQSIIFVNKMERMTVASHLWQKILSVLFLLLLTLFGKDQVSYNQRWNFFLS